jgi:hexosaminidase
MLTEATSTFTDDYLFIGGDEVSTTCWAANANIMSWLQRNNMTLADLQPYFEKRITTIARAAGKQVTRHHFHAL